MQEITRTLAARGVGAALASPEMGAGATLAAERLHYRTVAVGDVQVFYREAGPKDAPNVLLLTAGHVVVHVRRPDPGVATKYRVVAPDLPGFGLTETPPRWQFANDSSTWPTSSTASPSSSI